MLAANADGSYTIYTSISGVASVVEVADAATTSGANIQQFTSNGESCQAWILESATDPGCIMQTDVIYTFENANSGFLMDITDGTMAEGVNVQQWEQNDADAQKFVLTAFGSDNYYWIRSYQDNSYALTAADSGSGGNIELAAYNRKDSAQLFHFTKNIDGTYSILIHASKDLCLVEVANASLEYGANVQQWTPTSHACQKWNLATEVITQTTTTEVTTTVTETTTTTTTTTGATTITNTTMTSEATSAETEETSTTTEETISTSTETEENTTASTASSGAETTVQTETTLVPATEATAETTATTTTKTNTSSEDATTTTTTATTTVVISGGLVGDVDLNGTVALGDVIRLSRYMAGILDLSQSAYGSADVNADDHVDSEDAMILLKFQVQLIDVLPYTGES